MEVKNKGQKVWETRFTRQYDIHLVGVTYREVSPMFIGAVDYCSANCLEGEHFRARWHPIYTSRGLYCFSADKNVIGPHPSKCMEDAAFGLDLIYMTTSFYRKPCSILLECYTVLESTLCFIDIQSTNAKRRGVLGKSHEGLVAPRLDYSTRSVLTMSHLYDSL